MVCIPEIMICLNLLSQLISQECKGRDLLIKKQFLPRIMSRKILSGSGKQIRFGKQFSLLYIFQYNLHFSAEIILFKYLSNDQFM